jgi:hypothetical protein
MVGQGAAGVAERFGVALAGDGRRHGDQVAVALGQVGALPHLAEQHAVGETGQRRCDVAIGSPRDTLLLRHQRSVEQPGG